MSEAATFVRGWNGFGEMSVAGNMATEDEAADPWLAGIGLGLSLPLAGVASTGGGGAGLGTMASRCPGLSRVVEEPTRELSPLPSLLPVLDMDRLRAWLDGRFTCCRRLIRAKSAICNPERIPVSRGTRRAGDQSVGTPEQESVGAARRVSSETGLQEDRGSGVIGEGRESWTVLFHVKQRILGVRRVGAGPSHGERGSRHNRIRAGGESDPEQHAGHDQLRPICREAACVGFGYPAQRDNLSVVDTVRRQGR